MAKKIYTPGEAALLLKNYELLNKDLPDSVRTMMGVFALAPKVSTPTLEEYLGQPLGTTPIRHRSWFWYHCLIHSDLGKYWPEFKAMKNSGNGLAQTLSWLKEQCTKDEWDKLSDRSGSVTFKDRSLTCGRYSTEGAVHTIWTAGGVWDRRNGFTKIIILDETPDREDPSTEVQWKMLGHCERVAKEVHNFVDEERTLYHAAQEKAISYARERFSDLLNWKSKKIGPRSLSWFFDAAVPCGPIKVRWVKGVKRRRPKDQLTWLPPKT
jgi:hypothetical protein|tara:strand:+ start:22608 stop:23408 length:801 start_codon:yes stop_codon:yes gene_type:complete